MNIIFFEVDDIETKILQDMYGDIDYDTLQQRLCNANAEAYADAEIISCFIYSDLSRGTLQKLKNLKLIATRSRSTDHIDLDYCNQHNITVVNVPAYGEDTVAEYVFSLILSLTRHIVEAVRRTREGDFSAAGLQGYGLRGKTLGIIGMGEIGLRTAKIAGAFGMNVLGHDVRPHAHLLEEGGFKSATLEELLFKADIISLHVSSLAGSQQVLTDKEFALMKDGVVIINTSVGSAIDIKALLRALSSGKVAAVGLDVLPDELAVHEEAEFLRPSFMMQHDAEALLATHALLFHKNVIVTPHIAFYTKETVGEILRVTGDNIQAFQSGKLLGIVNQPAAAHGFSKTDVMG